uniref:Uncharacterized protein n=1 Tax=Eutreptiella gymnastica TaxID=73025 RepID=A0A7S1I0E2_9EUGL|mmetsp:Transcript_117950/g.205329  ORF Transcript_117950/g.205329 Transcript_117950/m.205329 type:complete len:225 (+) Transcript_117950:24-698(+)
MQQSTATNQSASSTARQGTVLVLVTCALLAGVLLVQPAVRPPSPYDTQAPIPTAAGDFQYPYRGASVFGYETVDPEEEQVEPPSVQLPAETLHLRKLDPKAWEPDGMAPLLNALEDPPAGSGIWGPDVVQDQRDTAKIYRRPVLRAQTVAHQAPAPAAPAYAMFHTLRPLAGPGKPDGATPVTIHHVQSADQGVFAGLTFLSVAAAVGALVGFAWGRAAAPSPC